jgi:hypothetical protein
MYARSRLRRPPTLAHGRARGASVCRSGVLLFALGLSPDDLAPDEAMRECFTGMANGMTNTSYWRVSGFLVTMLPPL